MIAWFDALPLTEQVFFFIALPATIILIIQTVLLFIGGDGDDPGDGDLDSDTSGLGFDGGGSFDIDADGPTDVTPSGIDAGFDLDGASGSDSSGDNTPSDAYGLRFVTLRGIIAFFTVAGWTGALCVELGLSSGLAVFFAVCLGIGAMIGIARLIQSLMRLQVNTNINYRHALGLTADVYLTIPANGMGTGKVMVTLGGALGEYDAITECGTAIETGRVVRVTDIVDSNVLVVEPVFEAVISEKDEVKTSNGYKVL